MTTKELREKRVRLAEEANQILKKAHEDKRELLKPDEEEAWQKLHNEIDQLKRHIDMQERQDALNKALDEPETRQTEPSLIGGGDRTSGPALRRLQRGQEESQQAIRLWLLGAPTSGYQYTTEDRSLLERCGIAPASKTLDLNFSTMPMRSPPGMRPDASSLAAAKSCV